MTAAPASPKVSWARRSPAARPSQPGRAATQTARTIRPKGSSRTMASNRIQARLSALRVRTSTGCSASKDIPGTIPFLFSDDLVHGPAVAKQLFGRMTLLKADELDGPVRVLAGPGAGKTQLLVDLYVDLVASGRAARGQVLVLTFSNAAAGEIAQRVDERLHDSYDTSWISTFHSFCARVLRDHRPDPGRLLMSGFQEWVAMRGTLPEVDAAGLGTLARVARTDGFAQDALAFVALLKQNRVHHRQLSLLAMTSGTLRLQALGAVYSAY